jgi:SH3 domain protein
MLVRLTLTVALLSGAGPALAETAYVTDSLRLGLYRTDDTTEKPIVNLVSGTPLEVLERNSSYARVRTSAGEEGWVKATYLVDDKPARLRVAELEAEVEGLRGEVDRAKSTHSNAEQELSALGKQIAASSESTGAMQDTLGRLQRENEAYEARLDAYRGALPLPWVGAALLVTAVGGFVGGLWWLDALIRRRHGGFRVY